MSYVLYGVRYNTYACGGIGDKKLKMVESKTEFFYTESEMLRRVASLKDEKSIGEVEPFIGNVSTTEYRIMQREEIKMNKIENIYEFIEQCKPSFRRNDDGELEMFSVPTQWISGESAEFLLNTGIELYKERGNQSPLSYILRNESEIPDALAEAINSYMESTLNKDSGSSD